MSDVQTTTQATVYTDTPVYDPVINQTAQQFTLDTQVTATHVEAGYTVGDELVLVERMLDPMGDPTQSPVDEARLVRGIGSYHSIYDASGQPIAVTTPPDVGTLVSPMAEISGEMTMQALTEGLVLEEADVSAAVETARAGNGVARLGGARGRPEKLPDGAVRVRSSLADLAASAPAGRPPVTPGEEGTLTRTFRPYPSGGATGVLVLEEAVFEVTVRHGQGRLQTRQHARFRNVRWNRNEARDRARRDGGRRPSEDVHPMLAPPPCEPDDLECGGSGGGGTGGGGTTPPPTGSCDGKPIQNVAFQHGIVSEAGTWGEVTNTEHPRGYFTTYYCLGSVVAPSQPTRGVFVGLATQGDNLRNEVAATGQSQFVFVGHSQGGLIARHAAQRLVAEGRGSAVEGVVTIGTPHQGAYFAQLATESVVNAVVGPFSGSALCGSRSTSAVCRLFAPMIANAAFNGILRDVMPTAVDNQPGSAFLTRVNATPETSFQRYGIQHYPPERWMPMRLIGDTWHGPHGFGNGRTWVTTSAWVYGGLRLGSVALWFVPGGGGFARFCRQAANTMDTVDRFYDRVTSPDMEGDGVIQGPSQIYPRASAQFTLRGGEAVSHTGETKSRDTRNRLEILLRDQFRAARR